MFRSRQQNVHIYCCWVELPFHVLFSSSESRVSLKRWIFEVAPPTRLYGPLCGFASDDDDSDCCCFSNRSIRFLALKTNDDMSISIV